MAASKLGESNVQEEDGLEEPVEGDPVKKSITPELKNAESSKHDPVCQEVGVIGSCSGFKCLERVVPGDDQRGKVGEELSNSTEVEEDE